MSSENSAVRRSLDDLESRRLEAMDLLKTGLNAGQVARQVGVARQTMSRWIKTVRTAGIDGLRRADRAGRRSRLSHADMDRLRELLQTSPRSHGFATDRWTCTQVAKLIHLEFGASYHAGHVWRLMTKPAIPRSRELT